MIAFVSQAFPVGTETFTYDEVVALRRSGLDVRVQSLRPGAVLPWDVSGIPIHTLPQGAGALARDLLRTAATHPRRFVRALGWSLRAAAVKAPARERLANLVALARGSSLARLDGVELYHAQFANEAATAAMIAADLTGARFSFRSHTSPSPRLLSTKLKRAAVVLAISDHDRALLLREEPTAHVEVARLGVAVAGDAPQREPRLIVSVGSLIEKKGHPNLVAACALLSQQGVDFRCEIVGAGWMREQLTARIAGAGLADKVVLRGHLDRPAVLELLGRAAVVALAPVPSAAEGEDGIPVALMEALAHGTPVVSTRISGIPELVVDEKTGLLVPPNDVPALAAALKRLLEDRPLAERLGEAGRARVRADYDPERNFAHAAALLAAAARPA